MIHLYNVGDIKTLTKYVIPKSKIMCELSHICNMEM